MEQIISEKMYEAYLIEAELLTKRDPLPRTEEGDRLDQISWLIATYEDKHYRLRNL
jgi:antitoxin component HigA of HigAB toxin-antitoxin module